MIKSNKLNTMRSFQMKVRRILASVVNPFSLTVLVLLVLVSAICLHKTIGWEALMAGLAAVVAILTFIHSLALRESEMVIKYQEKYFCPEMGDSLRKLNIFADDTKSSKDGKSRRGQFSHMDSSPPRLADSKLDGQEGGLDHWQTSDSELHQARRCVKEYFFTLIDLYELGYISLYNLESLCDKGGLVTLFTIVEPMERALNKKYDRSKFDQLYKHLNDIYKKQYQIVIL